MLQAPIGTFYSLKSARLERVNRGGLKLSAYILLLPFLP